MPNNLWTQPASQLADLAGCLDGFLAGWLAGVAGWWFGVTSWRGPVWRNKASHGVTQRGMPWLGLAWLTGWLADNHGWGGGQPATHDG